MPSPRPSPATVYDVCNIVVGTVIPRTAQCHDSSINVGGFLGHLDADLALKRTVRNWNNGRQVMRQRMLSEMLKERFGTKIYKLSLSSGCTCPNRDGSIGTGGCTFCSEGGSGEFAAPFLPLDDQIRLARQRVDAKIPRRNLRTVYLCKEGAA